MKRGLTGTLIPININVTYGVHVNMIVIFHEVSCKPSIFILRHKPLTQKSSRNSFYDRIMIIDYAESGKDKDPSTYIISQYRASSFDQENAFLDIIA